MVEFNMPSVFESFGWKSQTDHTIVSPLGINNRIHKLQIASQNYFTIGENARAADGNVLAISPRPGQEFDLNNEAHGQHLRACIELFKDKSKTFKAIDQKIAFSTVLGVVATSLSFIPFVSYFGLLGWGSALYHLTQRSIAEMEYTESLNLLVATCNWCLGEGLGVRKATKEALTSHEDIREMMTHLYPVLTEQQARHLIADDIEDIFVQELHHYESKYHLTSNANHFFVAAKNTDERIAQSKRCAEFSRCIYGYNKGSYSDYLDAFLSIFPDIYNTIHHGFKRLQHWWNSDSQNTEKDNTPSPHAPSL